VKFRALYAFLLVSSVLELSGCKSLLKKRDPDAAPSATPVAVPSAVVAPLPTTAPVAEAPAVDEMTVPTPQDFEDEAFNKVTPANFRVQFTTLKADISKP
jgi:hypothetical protein